MTDDIIDYDPQDFPEALAWFREARARHRRSRDRIRELEAAIKRHNDGAVLMIAEQATRIAELEAEVERLKTRVIAEEDDKNKRLDEMRAALAKQSLHVEDCHRQVEQAEAELAALKARRCETCRSQEEGLSYCSTLDVLTTEGFYCADWEARR